MIFCSVSSSNCTEYKLAYLTQPFIPSLTLRIHSTEQFFHKHNTNQGPNKLDNWGGGLIFIYSSSAQLISFEIDCFYGVPPIVEPPQLSSLLLPCKLHNGNNSYTEKLHNANLPRQITQYKLYAGMRPYVHNKYFNWLAVNVILKTF